MKYMGSKARIAKHILPIILKDRKEGQLYWEPFVGGANMIDKVEGRRLGSDSNEFLISALELIKDSPCDIPRNNSEFTRDDFMAAKRKSFCNSSKIEHLMMFCCSFSANFKGSFAIGHDGEDFVRAAFNSAQKQSKLIKGVKLEAKSYDSVDVKEDSIIYCDPPYANTAKYRDNFDHEKFWQWCRDKVTEGHQVFISEYSAPDDFVCIWSKEINSGLNVNTTKKGVERLFVHKSQVNQAAL